VDFATSNNRLRGTLTWIVAGTGHNLIFITQQTITAGPQPKPDDSAIQAVMTAAVNALEAQQ